MLVVLASLVALFLAPAASQETTVKVGFYGEALCPDCINFINGPLTHAFKEVSWCSLIRRLNLPRILQVPNIFTLHYAPWGNAKLVDDKFECQHGPMECTMNTVEACALNYYPNMYVMQIVGYHNNNTEMSCCRMVTVVPFKLSILDYNNAKHSTGFFCRCVYTLTKIFICIDSRV
jgi:hypothetical protein